MRTSRWNIGALGSILILACAGSAAAQGTEQRPRAGATAVKLAAAVEAPQVAEQPDTTPQIYFGREIFRFAEDYTLRAGQAVREVRTVFASIALEGKVDGDVVAVLGTVRIAGTASIGRSLVVIGGNATIEQGATVGGDLVVIGGALDAPPTFVPQGDHVVVGMRGLGTALQAIVPWFLRGLLWGRVIVPSLPWMWPLVGIVVFAGLVLNFLFDTPAKSAARALANRPLSAFLTGLLVLVLAGPLLVVLAASVIGLIVVPFAACALVGAGIFGKVAVARAIGAGAVPEAEDGNSRAQGARSFVIGSAVLVIAYMIPIVGLLTWVTTGALGLGAATMTFFTALRRERPLAPRAPEVPIAARSAAPAAGLTGTAVVSASSPDWTPEPAVVDTSAPPPESPVATRGPAVQDLSVYPRASFLDRLAAFALDCVLVGIANGILDVRRDEGGLFLLILFAYHIAFWAWKGTTLGGIIVGLRVVRAPGMELRFVDALVRGLSSIFSVAALGIGCFWMLQDPDRQMWHDKIAGTVVIKMPRELVLV